jgi:hypothetical protein
MAFATLNANSSVNPGEQINSQVLISTYTGNVQLVKNAQVVWNRDEALTTGVVSEFVELPPRTAIIGNHEGETFVGRALRHAGDLKVRH